MAATLNGTWPRAKLKTTIDPSRTSSGHSVRLALGASWSSARDLYRNKGAAAPKVPRRERVWDIVRRDGLNSSRLIRIVRPRSSIAAHPNTACEHRG